MRFILKVYVFLAIIFLCGCKGEIRDFSLEQFEKGIIVGVHNAKKNRDEIGVKASAGVNATIIFLSHTSVFIKFEDENAERKICDTGWILASEIRQIRERDILFLEITGSYLTKYNEWEKDKKIFAYNLSTRKLMGWVSSD